MNLPLVSVVTPFHNTAKYLAECIESVLSQTYSNFEYILVDNCSTDTSAEIVEKYASRDSRIKFVRRTELLPQVANYNHALTEISASSQYCKIVQADDYIFPDCIRLMVEAFEQSQSIGLVSAYDLKANIVRGSGFPLQQQPVHGRDAARFYLSTGIFFLGSPTAVMYRSSLVRASRPFYEEGLFHEDTEKCLQILKEWDFGFVYQVLSFLRIDEKSISSSFRSFLPEMLDRYINVSRYAPDFFSHEEAKSLIKRIRGEYYRMLGQQAIRFRDASFWKHHKDGLSTIGEKIDSSELALSIVRELLWTVFNPASSLAKFFPR